VCVMVFYLLTLLYHHPRFRYKRIFPLNYLLQGSCAATMVSAGILSTRGGPDRWTAWLGVVAGFLAFILGSPFKDYKDIDGDQVAGNETIYTLARNRARPIQNVHLTVTLTLTALMAAPALWLRWRGVPASLCVVSGVGACVSVPLALLGIQDRERATETALWLVNGYLLAYALLAWKS
jgi:4-hydroxybenzoate polyprenyltransferase